MYIDYECTPKIRNLSHCVPREMEPRGSFIGFHLFVGLEGHTLAHVSVPVS